MNIKAVVHSLVAIFIVSLSFSSNCYFSTISNMAKSGYNRAKKAVEDVTVKDVVLCATGVAAVGLAIYVVKQNRDIQRKIIIG